MKMFNVYILLKESEKKKCVYLLTSNYSINYGKYLKYLFAILWFFHESEMKSSNKRNAHKLL